MRNLQMSKWFKTPVDCTLVVNDAAADEASDSVSIDGHVILTSHHVEKIEIAINDYDNNQELIKKQQEQIDLLELKLLTAGIDAIELAVIKNKKAMTEAGDKWLCRVDDLVRYAASLGAVTGNAAKS
jgi:hypothetical protein